MMRKTGVMALIVLIMSQVGAGTVNKQRTFTELPETIKERVLTGVPRKSKDIPDSPFGIMTTQMHERSLGKTPEVYVKLMSDAGYKWVCEYLSNPHLDKVTEEQIAKRFTPYPKHVIDYAKLVRRYGMNLLVRLDAAAWGYKFLRDDQPTVEEKKKMELFIRAQVRALKPYTKHWQIWNEPNIGNDKPISMPKPYVRMVAFCAKIIKEEQPDAVVIAPGVTMLQCMGGWPYPWIPEVLKAGLCQYIDMFSYHPYRAPCVRENIPEHASEFFPWGAWRSYYKQIDDLKSFIRNNNKGKDMPLCTTEDGYTSHISPEGEQTITYPIEAKYELRKCLLDFWQGIYPRILFCLYRKAQFQQLYEQEASFNIILAHNPKEHKPMYYAVQNLHAVLDSTYKRVDDIDVFFKFKGAKPSIPGLFPVRSFKDLKSVQPGGTDGREGLYIQTYVKDHGDFEELLVFFWSAETSSSMHKRYPAEMVVRGVKKEWEAPLEIDLMAMPAPHLDSVMGKKAVEAINPGIKNKLQPKVLVAEAHPGGEGVLVKEVTVKDYPMLIKMIRTK